MTETRDELIAALESADGPSRELDALIHKMRLSDKSWYIRLNAPDGELYQGTKSTGIVACVSPCYTASIDAALTLVQDGWTYGMDNFSGFTHATVTNDVHGPINCEHKNPAIAICIAALKAEQS